MRRLEMELNGYEEYNEDIILCGANSYEQKYYLNPDFENLPPQVQDELRIMCVLFVHDVGGILILRFNGEGELLFDVSSKEGDPMFDEIGSGLLIRKVSREKDELLRSLELFYETFVA
jgi:hypothetical protein